MMVFHFISCRVALSLSSTFLYTDSEMPQVEKYHLLSDEDSEGDLLEASNSVAHTNSFHSRYLVVGLGIFLLLSTTLNVALALYYPFPASRDEFKYIDTTRWGKRGRCRSETLLN